MIYFVSSRRQGGHCSSYNCSHALRTAIVKKIKGAVFWNTLYKVKIWSLCLIKLHSDVINLFITALCYFAVPMWN